MPNRLAQESSPYLLQHQNNPVDWYPWGREALERAKSEDKPILLSIGYSACHWCHVMEHESFESQTIAAQMNEQFVCIKVDREERPDLDQIYQNVAQAMTQSGGWPLTVFLTPDLKPYFGGTYFPPEDRYGRPGLPRVLEALSRAYRDDRASVLENAEHLNHYIATAEGFPQVSSKMRSNSQKEKLKPAKLKEAAEAILSRMDLQDGGISGSPKFPNTMILSYLWRFGIATGDGSSKHAVIVALTKMACGGIYDQLGGGFSRYSVDETWSVPHFEKMLYDNGLLLKLYAEVLMTNDPLIIPPQKRLFRKVLRETIHYLAREMTIEDGVFQAAQDADSEGEEGKFFAWNKQDLRAEAHLTEEEALFAERVFGISDNGNFEHGKTVLHIAPDLMKVDFESTQFKSVREKLFQVRSRRVPPAQDNKVLVSWNGLAISGLIWSACALELAGDVECSTQARAMAKQAFDFVVKKISKNGRLSSTFQNGKPKLNAYLDDYAFMAMAALDLARFEKNQSELMMQVNAAAEWTQTIRTHFSDAEGKGFFYTSDDHEKLIHRPMSIYDQAIPAGISVTLELLLVLSEMDLDGQSSGLEAIAVAQLEALSAVMTKSPFGFGELLCAALLQQIGPHIVAGPFAADRLQSPHVFQKTASHSKKILCRQKTCVDLGPDASPGILKTLSLKL